MIKQLLLLTLLFPSIISTKQGSVHVSGRLSCHGEPYANERVQIFEKNYVLSDTRWSETLTDENGDFEMKAWGNDWFSVTPYLYIPNYCGANTTEGKRCTTGGLQVNIPAVMISKTHVPLNKFDVGTVELNTNSLSEHLGLGSLFGGVFAVTKECREYKHK